LANTQPEALTANHGPGHHGRRTRSGPADPSLLDYPT